jgi:hypothetical protein
MKLGHRSGVAGACCAFLMAFMLGCASENQPFDPAGLDLDTQVDPAAGSFRIAVTTLRGGEGVVLDGEDLVIDRERGQVGFRAALVNASPVPLYAPIRLVLTHLDPVSVASLDPDGRTEAGEPYYDWTAEVGADGVLGPGETSQRTGMTFANADQRAFSLGALLESNLGPARNAIGGSIFLDRRPNGRRDRDEPGIPDVELALLVNGEQQVEAVTDADGRYVFLGLGPGLYAVRAAVRDLATATPNPLHMVLVPIGDGEASSFLAADFACFRRADPGSSPPPLVGPVRVLARGETATESFDLDVLPERPLVLLAELRGDDAAELVEADLSLNGQPVVGVADFLPDLRLVRREILPDLLKPGLNTLEVRAVAREEREAFVVVTIR